MNARRAPAQELRRSPLADFVRETRLVVVLRRVAPRARLLALVDELADAGARVFEITFDAEEAGADLAACREHLGASRPDAACLFGAGTIRTADHLRRALAASADFAVSPSLDGDVLRAAIDAGLPFIPGAFTPTEVDRAWRLGATFVKLFPASALGPSFVRELRGPMPEVETIPTGGIDASNAAAFLAAGAGAIGIGSAFLRATPADRRAMVEQVAGSAAAASGSLQG